MLLPLARRLERLRAAAGSGPIVPAGGGSGQRESGRMIAPKIEQRGEAPERIEAHIARVESELAIARRLQEALIARKPQEEPLKILVVEDEPDARQVLMEALRGRGYEVLAARGISDAAPVLGGDEGVPHVVLLDTKLPRLAELISRIRSLSDAPTVLHLDRTEHGTIEPAERSRQSDFTAQVLRQSLRFSLADLLERATSLRTRKE
jgi:CheY-like chemotaxis protein